jgi:hypothetical protein
LRSVVAACADAALPNVNARAAASALRFMICSR